MSAAAGEGLGSGVLAGGAAGYQPARLPDIQETLSKLFAELQEDSGVYSRAASTNVLIPVGSPEGANEVESLIDAVAQFHPSRFFVYGVNDQLAKVSAEVSARCHFTSKGGGKSQHVCSELVRIGAPRSAIAALAEVLRANLVTGTPTELLLFDPQVDESLISVASPLSDQLILDSSMWLSRPRILEQVLVPARRSIDLQWVALGPWRDHIKVLFDVPSVRGLGVGVQKITIECDAADAGASLSGMPMSALLFAGWIQSRLKLRLQGCKPGVFDLSSDSGGAVRCAVTVRADRPAPAARWLAGASAPEPKLRLVRFEGTVRGGKGVQIEIERKDGLLEGRVRGEETVVLTRPLEDESGEGRLRRYFLIGESTANYLSSAQHALHLLRGMGATH